MAQLMKREKEMEATREQRAKVTAEREKLLRRFLVADALNYLEGLKTREPAIGKQVEEVILYLIVYRGTSDFGSYVREAIRKGSDE